MSHLGFRVLTLFGEFVCHCRDCRHLSASAFCSNFTIKGDTLKYVRGEDKIKTYAQSSTIETGNTMTNYFCSNCGSLMYRGTCSLYAWARC